MGSAESTPQPPVRSHSRRDRRLPARPTANVLTLDEKFDALKLDHDGSPSAGRSLIAGSKLNRVDATATAEYVEELLKSAKHRLGLSALSSNNPSVVLEKQSSVIKNPHYYNVTIPHEGSPVTNQRSSGRCWIFAATNIFRIAIMQKYNIKSFELSQSYLFYYDKIEKAFYFLESILDTVNEDIDSRLVSALTASPVGDGGQWDMIVNLVSKYGIVPQALYPDSWNAQNSAIMVRLLTNKLREDGLILRSLKSGGANSAQILEAKEAMMRDIVRIVTLCLGPPPRPDEKFTFEYYDRNDAFKTISLTPIEFADTTHVKRFFSLVNDPRNDYYSLLTVDHLGNVWNGRPVTYVNVDADVLKAACIAMLKKGLPVFFGSDVGKQSDINKGVMDTDLIDYELGFNVQLGMTKAERLLTGESQMTHAMVLTAVHLDKDGKPVRWRVENSYSDQSGVDGYNVMSDKWMTEFCYQVVVDPSVVSKEVTDVLKQEPKVLPLWDPMGALA